MEKKHTPSEIRPNRTSYQFTEQETIEALLLYLAREETVPVGRSHVWLNDGHSEIGWKVALIIDHFDPPPEATAKETP